MKQFIGKIRLEARARASFIPSDVMNPLDTPAIAVSEDVFAPENLKRFRIGLVIKRIIMISIVLFEAKLLFH